MVWYSQGQDTLDEFLQLNSVHKSVQFTMEVEKGGVDFLDFLVFQNADGSLGRTVFIQPTPTNLYLNNQSFHHPGQKCGVLATLV